MAECCCDSGQSDHIALTLNCYASLPRHLYKNQQIDNPEVDCAGKQKRLKLLISGIKEVASLWNLQKYKRMISINNFMPAKQNQTGTENT